MPDHTLIRRVGKGSYGEVWLARNALGTWRAVKIVRRSAFDDDRPYERELAGIQRFEPVSRSHESQLNILQVGRAEEAFYYVMEVADEMGRGQDIHPATYTPHNLRSELHLHGRLPAADCLRIGLALTTALEHLHKHGLVHRDIKPSNIVFVNGIPKLADIGLVARAEATMSFVGTEGFLPPEGPGTRQADIYSLGKVLYELSTGHDRQQFPELPTNIADLPDRPLLGELNEVLIKACHRDPAQRYQTAAEMHADLALLESGRSVVRMRGMERRLRLVQRAGAIITGLAAVIALGWWWQARQTRTVRRLVAEKAVIAEEGRNRIVRLDIANGVRLLDEGDPTGALLWFVDALPLLTNHPAGVSVQRVRIQQTLDQTPHLSQVFAHDSAVTAAAFSPDGRFLATGTIDGQIRLWDATTGSRIWGPKRMAANVVFLRFSRDGKRLFASSSVEQWAFNGGVGSRNFHAVLETGSGDEMLPTPEAGPTAFTNLICSHFSPDDRWLATASTDNRIRVFDLADGHLVREFAGHSGEVRFLSFSSDGSLLASASLDRTARLWQLPSGEPAGLPLEHRFPVVRALLAHGGRHLITASFEHPGNLDGAGSFAGIGELQTWELETGRRVGEPILGKDWLLMFLNPAEPTWLFAIDSAYRIGSSIEPLYKLKAGDVQSWAFAKDNRRMAVGVSQNAARILELPSGTTVAGPFPHGGEVTAMQFSPDQRFLLTACDDGNARLWDLRQNPAESVRRTLPAPMTLSAPMTLGPQVSRSPGVTAVLMGPEQGLWLFDDRLEPVQRLRPSSPGNRLHDIRSAWQSNLWTARRLEPDGKAAVLFHPQGTASQPVLLPHPDTVIKAVFTRDDRFVITSCLDGVVRFWRTSDGELANSTRVHGPGEGWVPDVSPDGRTALWAHKGAPQGQEFNFLDLKSGEIRVRFQRAPSSLVYTLFSPDSLKAAFAEFSGKVTVMDVRSGEPDSPSMKHSGNLSWIEWSPDSRRLLTAGHNDEVLVWDVQTGAQLLGPLRMPGGIIRVARWSPDGRFIVARNDDKKVRVWDAATGEAVTPLLAHSGEVAFAFLTGSNRLITATYPDELRAWDLEECPLPADVLRDYAKLVSGRQLNAAGVMLPLKPADLAELNRSLRARAPQWFE